MKPSDHNEEVPAALKGWSYDYGDGRSAQIFSSDDRTFIVTLERKRSTPSEPGQAEGASSLEAAMDLADKWTGVETEASAWHPFTRAVTLTMGPAITAMKGDEPTNPTRYEIKGLPAGSSAFIQNERQMWQLRMETAPGTPSLDKRSFGRPEEALLFLEVTQR